MPYQINEGTLPIDAEEDRSINVFAIKNPDGAPLQAIITRDKGEPGESLAASVERQIKILSRQVKEFKALANEEIQITEANWPAILREHSFKQSNQSAYQLQIIAQTPAQGFMIFTLSSIKPFSDSHRQAWIKTVTSFKPVI